VRLLNLGQFLLVTAEFIYITLFDSAVQLTALL